MRFSWIRAGGAVVVSAAVMALQAAPALAQFVPYSPGNTSNQSYNQYQAHTAQPQYQAQPQAQTQYQFGQHMPQPQYTAMAFQGSGAREALGQPVESVAPGQLMQSAPPQTAAMPSYSAAPAADCNCQSSAPAMSYSQPAPVSSSFESYQFGGCTAGACGNYNTFDAGCGVGGYAGCDGGCGAGGCGLGGGCSGAGCGCGRRWFGGFYGLYMERAGNPWRALAFQTTDGQPFGYYPTDSEYSLNLTDIDNDTFAGAEIRLGSTLGSRGCYGWEIGVWGLDEDTVTATATDVAGTRLYSMINHIGMEYSPTGLVADYRPVNDYFDYAPPTEDHTTPTDVEVRSITARNSFSLQNYEANFLCFTAGNGFFGGGGAGWGGGPAGGGFLGRRGGLRGRASGGCCDVGGCDSCAGGTCGVNACGCGSRCSITGVAGFRFIRMDEDFMFRSDWDTGFLSRNIDVDSHLYGGQIGCNTVYRCGRSGRWALHCNTVVGIFNNHIEVWNRMDNPATGTVRLANNGQETFDFRYEDDQIAVLGELRAGASYQYSCNWRLFGGYRLFGLSGAALAFDQIAAQNISASQVQYVDSTGSIFLHGLQGGIECTY